jgi:archaemetzincin
MSCHGQPWGLRRLTSLLLLGASLGCSSSPRPEPQRQTTASAAPLDRHLVEEGGPSATLSATSVAAVSGSTQPVAPGAASVAAATATSGGVRPRLYLQAMGDQLPKQDVAFVKLALEAFYALEVVTLAPMPLPPDAWYAQRQRYRAEVLLEHLATRLPADGKRILGLTGVDISTTKGDVADWGILGLATVDGSACVLSAFRTARGAQGPQGARVRLGKVAVHELGHTFGLRHCPTWGCLMEDARGTVATTDRERDLCPICRKQLVDRGVPLDQDSPIPWP